MPEYLNITLDDATLPESGGLLDVDISTFSADEDLDNIITFVDGGDFAGGVASGIYLSKMGNGDNEPDEFWFDLAQFDDDFSIGIKSEGPEDTFFFQRVVSSSEVGGIYTINYRGSDDAMHTITLDPGDASVMLLCLARGTRIETPTGRRRIEALRVGDPVLTATSERHDIRYIGRRRVVFSGKDDSQKPILIPANALGPNVPERDLVVSPLHRVFLCGPGLWDATGHDVVAVPAKGLVGWNGIRQKTGQRAVEYFTILLEDHQPLLAEGAPVESLFPGDQALLVLPDADRAAIAKVLSDVNDAATPAAPFLSVQETRDLVADLRFAERTRARANRSGNTPKKGLHTANLQ